jgi:hypothetical protein
MDRTEEYEEHREVGRELNSKLMDSYLDHDILMDSARLLGIVGEDDTLVFDTDDEMSILMDFALNDYQQQGRTAVEVAWENQDWENEMEKDHLEGLLSSYTSLFKVTAVNSSENVIEMYDVLNNESVELTDIGFSKTATQGLLVFFRLVSYENFNATSGISFAYRGDIEDHLQTVYRGVKKNVESQSEPVKRYVSFYKLYGKYGADTRYI